MGHAECYFGRTSDNTQEHKRPTSCTPGGLQEGNLRQQERRVVRHVRAGLHIQDGSVSGETVLETGEEEAEELGVCLSV